MRARREPAQPASIAFAFWYPQLDAPPAAVTRFPVRSSTRRLVARTAAIALAIAIGGFGWGAIRFGLTDRGAADRLEREVRRLVADRSRQVESLAERV
jgi:hypothetical protein